MRCNAVCQRRAHGCERFGKPQTDGWSTKTALVFSPAQIKPDKRVAERYTALMRVSFAAGLVSTMQGFISHALSRRDMAAMALAMPFDEAFA